MKNKLSILYVHGLNSDGNSITGKLIERALREALPTVDITVKHPTFPKTCTEALEVLNKESKEVNIVIGTSLGGFITLNARTKYRIVFNPALRPSETLLELGESNEVASSYKPYEDKLYKSIDGEDRITTVSYFADNDTVVRDGDEFKKIFHHINTFHGEHRLREKDMPIVVTEVKKYISLLEGGHLGELIYPSNSIIF